jgi:spermidine/putrescine transport system permease protein
MNFSKIGMSMAHGFFIFLMYLFFYIPIIVLIVFSFNDSAFPAPWTSFSLKWYYELYESVYLWNALYNSLIVSISATFLSLSMTLGFIFYNVHQRYLEVILPIFYINLIIPEVVLAVGLLSLFTFFAIPLGIPTLIVSHTILGLGYAIPVVYSRFKELDPCWAEASLDLGASHIQTFFKVTVPLLIPALVTSGLLIFIISFDDFVLSYFCAGSSSETLSLHILSMLRTGVSPVVNALSTLLILLSSLLVFVYCFFSVRVRVP